ncbi:hypothetical protein TSUD_11340 [Trifolium subterraneum]|nr:hypothetical protein TSUD_11340 [Trifolium subterraneum]
MFTFGLSVGVGGGGTFLNRPTRSRERLITPIVAVINADRSRYHGEYGDADSHHIHHLSWSKFELHFLVDFLNWIYQWSNGGM